MTAFLDLYHKSTVISTLVMGLASVLRERISRSFSSIIFSIDSTAPVSFTFSVFTSSIMELNLGTHQLIITQYALYKPYIYA